MPDTRAFAAERPRLVRLAYRMTGSLAEAEDVVQDAWFRWAGTAPGTVVNPAAWLTRTVTRLCLDHLKSARVRRETYVGAWLPEPLLGTVDPEPVADDLTLTLMLALERLSPLERAAFLLHDVFEVALPEVAATLDRAPAAVRQLAARARRHVAAARPRYTVDRGDAERIAAAFFAASRDGDSKALAGLLAADVTIHADGGGRVLAFRNVIRGADRVRRLYAGLARKHGDTPPKLLAMRWIDGLPGYVSRERGDVVQTTALELREGRIAAVYVVRNPDKLAHVLALHAAAATRG
ncbi:RNA polymerase sigma factor SigJ [Sphingomonas sp. RRHST34]|uniref:RNA polymerase sigma factor SigJ n=1 Tax=Sphingomonas citri TaxID=2862499 RepID=A0ABS7BMK6_9SPHN|nr:RNA polymerase sigma factor SigJ [Sphingomonas citri]MBW6530842.1 RNA polymerase sigma factor SigJ [Sphingomonas citri]